MNDLPYGFMRGESALMFEIYMAADPGGHLLELLLRVLKDASDGPIVREHFLLNQERIVRFSKKYDPNDDLCEPWQDRMDGFNKWRPYHGYSRYVTKGVFKNQPEEDSVVARVAYVVPVSRMCECLTMPSNQWKSAQLLCNKYFRSWTHDLIEFKRDLKWPLFGPPGKFPPIDENIGVRLLDSFNEWQRTVGFFKYGLHHVQVV